MTLRYFVLTVNYRKPLDFTEESLKSAAEAWKNINIALSLVDISKSSEISFNLNEQNELIEEKYKDTVCNEISKKKQKFADSLSNDLNTAGAIAIIYELAKPLKNFINQLQRLNNVEINSNKKFFLFENFITLKELTEVLGLKKEVALIDNKIDEEQILSLINERLEAKKIKNYEKADNIRNFLKGKGIELIDQSPEKTTWIKI